MQKLAQLLRAEMEKRKLSVRQAAIQMGLSHVTVTRVLAALPVDVQTMMTVCDWLGISLIDVLDQQPGDANLARQLAVLINRDPDLGKIFSAALAEVENGEMDASDFLDIIEYATFKIERSKRLSGKSKTSADPSSAKAPDRSAQ
jgi:transcriptional regulator with XRE-family HTH domain